MAENLTDLVSAACGARVDNMRALSSSWGMRLYRAELAGHGAILIKHGRSQIAGHLAIEGFMLNELAAKTPLPAPRVFHANDELLVMAFVDSVGAMSRAHERHAGELMAACHSVPQNGFGYAQDTIIGALTQTNKVREKWTDFFRDQRLLYMAGLAHERGQLPSAQFGRIEKLAGRLENYISEPAHSSFLHGDLWGGNVLLGPNGKISAFIDPAIYCGHAEIELAFTQMFGTFGTAFFESYRANGVLEKDFFELRCDIYNLYPTLVHVVLFGASYLSQVDRTLARVGV